MNKIILFVRFITFLGERYCRGKIFILKRRMDLINKDNSFRYEFLSKQFYVSEENPYYFKVSNSLNRVFDYIYHCTDLMYIEFIDEEILYEYIKYHRRKNFKKVSFPQVIKDIKNYVFFLNNIKRFDYIPKVNLSTENYYLWLKI